MVHIKLFKNQSEVSTFITNHPDAKMIGMNAENNDVVSTNTTQQYTRFLYHTTDQRIIESPHMSAIISNSYEGGLGTLKVKKMDTVPYIGFQSCYNLEDITIPYDITALGDIRGGHVFNDCYNLKSISILNPNCEIVSDDVFLGVHSGSGSLSVPSGSWILYHPETWTHLAGWDLYVDGTYVGKIQPEHGDYYE